MRRAHEAVRQADPSASAPGNKGWRRRPLYLKTAEDLGVILRRTEPGRFLPSEPALAQRLGISRATLREAMRSFEEQGVIVRRQGVGTYVARPLKVMEAGLEVLESVETLARKIGLEVDMGDLQVEASPPSVERPRAWRWRPGRRSYAFRA